MAVCGMVLFIFASGACSKFDVFLKTAVISTGAAPSQQSNRIGGTKTEEIENQKYGNVSPIDNVNQCSSTETYSNKHDRVLPLEKDVIENAGSSRQFIDENNSNLPIGKIIDNKYDSTGNSKKIVEENSHEGLKNSNLFVLEEKNDKLEMTDDRQANKKHFPGMALQNLDKSKLNIEEIIYNKYGSRTHLIEEDPDEKHQNPKHYIGVFADKRQENSMTSIKNIANGKQSNNKEFLKETVYGSHDTSEIFTKEMTDVKHDYIQSTIKETSYEKNDSSSQNIGGLADQSDVSTKQSDTEKNGRHANNKQLGDEMIIEVGSYTNICPEESNDSKCVNRSRFVKETAGKIHENTKEVAEKIPVKRQVNPKHFIAGIAHEGLGNTKEIVEEDSYGRQGNSKKLDIADAIENSTQQAGEELTGHPNLKEVQCFIESLLPRGLTKNNLSNMISKLNHIIPNLSNNKTVCRDNHYLTNVHPQLKTDIVKTITKLIVNTSELINNKNRFGETALLSSASMNDTALFEVILKEKGDPYLSNQQKMTSLHYAAKNGNARIIILILDKSTTGIDFQNSLGETALLIAVAKNDLSICKLLLEYCANPYVADIFGNNTLHVSSKTGNLDIVRIILSNDKSGLNLKNDVGMTAIHAATEMKHGGVVEILLENGADPFETNLFHQTALHTAVRMKCSRIVDAILNKTISGIDMRDKEGNTALHIAAVLEDTMSVRTLLDHRADPNLPNTRRQTPLHAAAWNISNQPPFEIMYTTRIAGKEAEQNLFFPRYATGNRRSVKGSPPDVLQMLLDNKNTSLNRQDDNGDTALHYAIISGRHEAVDDLLQYGADPYLQNEQGNTPLHIAILAGSDSIAEAIMKWNNSGIDIRNKHNYTALFYTLYYTKIRLNRNINSIDDAEETTTGEILRILDEYFYNLPDLHDVPYSLIPSQLFEKQLNLAEKASTDQRGLFLKPNKNVGLQFFAYHSYIVGGNYECIDRSFGGFKLNHDEISNAQFVQDRLLEKLLKYGADTKLTDGFGRTILHAAAEFFQNRFFEKLSSESSINAQDNKGSTPILNAAKKFNYFAVDWFLKNSADPYMKDKEGETCLHAAARVGNILIIRLILSYNDTGIDLQNSKGETAIIIAAEHYDIDMVMLLLNSGADPYLTDISGRTPLHKVVVEWTKTFLFDVTNPITRQKLIAGNYPGSRIRLESHLKSEFDQNVLCLSRTGTIFSNGKFIKVYEFSGSVTEKKVLNILKTFLNKNSSGINERDVNGYSALFLAAVYCEYDVIELLLNKGADPYLQDKAGHTSLHALISRKDFGRWPSILRMFIKGGNGINLADNAGFTALHFAVLRRMHNLVTILSESGADPNIQDNYHGLSPFYFALRSNDRLISNYLLSNNFTNLNIMSKIGKTSLHYAREESIFHSLLQKGAELHHDYLGWTPLHYAGSRGSINKVKMILARFPRSIDVRTYLGETTLSIAVEKSNLEIANYLLTLGADPKIPNDLLQTSLEKAAMNNNSSVFKMLFEKGVDPFVINNLGYSCLHVVSQLGNIGNAELIFRKFNGKIDYRDRVGHTPLHYAISRKQYGFVEYLLNRSASPFAFDNYGQNALHYASEGSSREIVAAIYNNAELHGNAVDLNKFINKRNVLEISSVEVAAASGNKGAFLYLLEKGADLHVTASSMLITAAIGGDVGIIQHILDKTGAAVDSMTITGFTALMAAAYKGRRDAFYYLLWTGADPQMVTAYGQTLLHHAAVGGDVFILNTSLSFCKACTNSIDVEGYTPLMYAVQHDNDLAAHFLLYNNADAKIKNINGEDSFSLAARKGNKVLKPSFLKVLDDSPDILLGTLLVRKDIRLMEDILLELAGKSSLSRDPVFLAAAKGDIHQLHELFAAGVRVRRRSFPGIMKEFMRDLDDVMASLVTNDEFIQSHETRLSPLDIALSFRRNLSVVNVLVQKLNVDFEALNYRKALWTPVDFAIFAHDREPNLKTQQVLFYLLNAYKDKVNHRSNIYEWTLVHKTAWIGNSLAFRFLRSFGADLNKSDVFGRTPLHIAALNGHAEIVKSILRSTKSSINSKDVHGFTPLLLCHVYKYGKLFQRLSTAKSDMDPKERFKFVEFSSLFVNTFEGKHDLFLETAASLIDEEADMNVQDRAFGWTALHWAVASADYLGVVQLVSRGAMVNIPSRTGETPMALARKWVRKATYNYLKKHNGVW